MMDALPLTRRLQLLESDVLYDVPPADGQDDFRYLPGPLPVLLSAPHGAAHYRNDRVKQEDEYTAAFARLIAEETGAQALYVHRRSRTDHNYYRETPYKLKLKELAKRRKIRFVLDLHGASDEHDFGIALGMMNGISCPHQAQTILDSFALYGFTPFKDGHLRVDVDHAFKGGGGTRQETITGFVFNDLGLPAAQLEINACLRIVFRMAKNHQDRPFSGNKQLIEKVIGALITLVTRLADQL